MNDIERLNSELNTLNSRLQKIEMEFSQFDIARVKKLEAHVLHRIDMRSVSNRTSRRKEREAVLKFFEDVSIKDLVRLKGKAFGKRLFFLGDFEKARMDKFRYDYNQSIERFFITEQSQNEQQKSNQKMIIDLEKQLKELKKIGFGGLFSSKPSKKQYEQKLNSILTRLSYLSKIPYYSNSYIADEQYLYKICKLSHKYYDQVSEIDKKMTGLKKEIAEFKKQEKHNLKMAKAAAYDNETRQQSRRIKPQIPIQSNCPYCGTEIGSSSHLDHIHPVSKGGLNIPENLVNCCSTCNLKKADKGVFQFCREQGFNYEKVCDRLLVLGKHI